MLDYQKPVLGICAFSGTGKTTLLKKLLPILKERGVIVAVVKHAHHSFEMDYPGKDSYELRKSGAGQVLVASRQRIAMIREYEQERPEPVLADALALLDPTDIDLVLVEGFRHVPFPKIELHRPASGHDLIYPGDPSVIAVATDEAIDTDGLPRLDINRPEEVMGYIVRWMKA